MVNKCAESLDSFYRVRILKKWSGFSLQCVQLGPDPDFFDQTGPDLVWNLVRSPDFSKNCQTNA